MEGLVIKLPKQLPCHTKAPRSARVKYAKYVLYCHQNKASFFSCPQVTKNENVNDNHMHCVECYFSIYSQFDQKTKHLN